MAKLMIVESPNKCKKIQSILGQGWIVKASMGHVRDLPSKEMGVDLESFQPQYVPNNDKGKKVLAGLRKVSRTAEEVWLATDPDREGEAIAWHLQEALRLKHPVRVTFNAITKQAISEAVRLRGRIDMALVRAQEGRRVLDRLVGYSVSSALTRACGNGVWLTAGRVQSVALRVVVERELEISRFKPVDYVEVWLLFETDTIAWRAKWQPGALMPEGHKHWTNSRFAGQVAQMRDVSVKSVEKTQRIRRPPPPFITSTLQQAASVVLKMSPKRCMQVAQELFGAGLITYHRTDNPNLSDDGLREVVEWLSQNGYREDVADPANKWKATAGAQEGHEAIRPTSIEAVPDQVTDNMAAEPRGLYLLIWQRAVACQMKPAKYHVTSIGLASVDLLEGKPMQFEARGEQMLYPGWLKLSDRDATVDEGEEGETQQLPVLREQQPLTAHDGEIKNKQTKPPARYTEASLVKKMEAEGVGRPSTYASILDNIVQRGYVVIEKRKLVAKKLGILIVNTLVKRFRFMELGYTREIESQLDGIAFGHNQYLAVVATAYRDLAEELKQLDGVVVEHQPQETHPCPECEKPLILIQNKFWGCSGYPACRYKAPNDKGAPGTPRSARRGDIDKTHPCACGNGYLQRRQSQGRHFWGCSTYPTCRNSLPDKDGAPGKRDKTVNQGAGEDCPTCQEGHLVLRTVKSGKNQDKHFHGCTNYPECRHFSWR